MVGSRAKGQQVVVPLPHFFHPGAFLWQVLEYLSALVKKLPADIIDTIFSLKYSQDLHKLFPVWAMSRMMLQESHNSLFFNSLTVIRFPNYQGPLIRIKFCHRFVTREIPKNLVLYKSCSEFMLKIITTFQQIVSSNLLH